MRITVITLGKLKENCFCESEAEYLKRLRPYFDVKYMELVPCRLPDNPSQKQIEQALEKEGQAILSKTNSRQYIIALCVEGKQLTSENFAKELSYITAQGTEIVIIIGSSFGLSEKVKTAAKLRLSLSKMTLPHSLARVVLAEQLYRAATILNNAKYHK